MYLGVERFNEVFSLFPNYFEGVEPSDIDCVKSEWDAESSPPK
jgi:hypothetical protein